MVDVVVNFGRASDIFDTAPDFHKDVLVVRGYSGSVELGWEWDGTNFLPLSQEDLSSGFAKQIRQIRETILTSQVDPLVSNPLRWADLKAEKQAEWAQYRTDLLNITDQPGFPHDVSWPKEPV